jgi:protein-disulfide isomerase
MRSTAALVAIVPLLACFWLLPSAAAGGADDAGHVTLGGLQFPVDPHMPVARVGERVITLGELDAELPAAIARALNEIDNQRREALIAVLERVVLEQQAAERGVTEDALLETIYAEGVAPVTEAESRAFFEARETGGAAFEEYDQQIRDFLLEERRSLARQLFVGELLEALGTQPSLPPPRRIIELDDRPGLGGPPTAPVVLIEFTDYQCPYCAQAYQTVKELQAKYGERLHVALRDFPLSFHDEAPKAAEAVRCAAEQGAVEGMRDRLFAHQDALSVDQLKGHADELGLKRKAFARCLDSDRYAAAVQADLEAGSRLGVAGTPSFFINGIYLSGAQPMEAFLAIIDDELAHSPAP